MQRRSKLTPTNLMIIYLFVVMGTANFFVPAARPDAAGRDAWLTVIGQILPSLIIIYILGKLVSRYPELSFPLIAEKLIGKVAGKALSIMYVVFLITTNDVILRQFIEFVAITFLPETPRELISLTMVILVGFLLSKDISTLGNVSYILAWVFLGSFIFLFLLTINQFQIQNIFPILEKGVKPIIRAIDVPVAWNSEAMLLFFYLFTYTNDKTKALGKMYLGVILIVFFKFITILSVIFTMYPDTNLVYPVFMLVRVVNIQLLMHLDVLLFLAWVTGIFIKVTAFQCAALIGLGDTLRLKSYKILIWPSLIILHALAFISYESGMAVSKYIGEVWPYYGMLFQVVIPALLLILSFVRGVENGRTSDNSSDSPRGTSVRSSSAS